MVPLAPHGPGAFMCWSGNTIHWGSACRAAGAADPRTSIALVFRRRGAALSQTETSLSRADVAAATAADRLKMVRAALKFFSHWYPDDTDLSFRGAIACALPPPPPLPSTARPPPPPPPPPLP